MDKATLTMIENLRKNTGRSLEQWVELVKEQQLGRHGEVIKFLKETHGLTHGYANLVAHNAKEGSQAPGENREELIGKQYKGKEHFMPLYEHILREVLKMGDDVQVAPMNSYVSLKRKKQFAALTPATRTRFELGLNLRGEVPAGKLEAAKPNSMCSHKINLTEIDDVDAEVMQWLRKAFDRAG